VAEAQCVADGQHHVANPHRWIFGDRRYRQPVQFDVAEACQQNRPPTCLFTGAPGSGKTIAVQMVEWQACLQGSAIVDIDPKGDHRFERLPGISDRVETVELSGHERYSGRLDPMRIGTEETREDLAYNFLVSILPTPVKPEWQTQLRLAVSEAAAWTGRRWFGGRYEIVPNGVDVDAAPSGPKPASDGLRVLFVGRPEERKGLPILLTAFGALIEHVPCRLTVIGAEREDVRRYLADRETMRWIDVRGRVAGADLWTALHEADLLCAPSLSGESFGMVLTEAFAAGTPALASAIAGYSDVVTDGVDGILVPPGDPQRLAEELQQAHHEPERLAAMGEAARRSAERYAWPPIETN